MTDQACFFVSGRPTTHARRDACHVGRLSYPLFSAFVPARLGDISASHLIGSESFPRVRGEVPRASATRCAVVRAPPLTGPPCQPVVAGLFGRRVPTTALLITPRRPLHLPRAVFAQPTPRTRLPFASLPQCGALLHRDASSHTVANRAWVFFGIDIPMRRPVAPEL